MIRKGRVACSAIIVALVVGSSVLVPIQAIEADLSLAEELQGSVRLGVDHDLDLAIDDALSCEEEPHSNADPDAEHRESLDPFALRGSHLPMVSTRRPAAL